MKSLGLAILFIAAAPFAWQFGKCIDFDTSAGAMCDCIGEQYVASWKAQR